MNSASSLSSLTPTNRNLCGVRLDNSLPFAQPASVYGSLPPSCFNDVVLVPLASWIFYVALAVWLVLPVSSGRRNSSHEGGNVRRSLQRYGGKVERSDGSIGRRRWSKTRAAGTVLYTLLIIASLLMNILEIVRLALVKPNSRGIGLLPFTLASILLILIVIHLPVHSTSSAIRPWMTSLLTLCFWVPALIFTSIKLRVLGILMGPEPRTGSEYLDSDQQIDVGVIVGLYVVFILIEAARLLTFALRRGDSSQPRHLPKDGNSSPAAGGQDATKVA